MKKSLTSSSKKVSTLLSPLGESSGTNFTDRVLSSFGAKIAKDIKTLISDLSGPQGKADNTDVITEMIVTAIKGSQSGIGRGDLKLLSRSMRELRFAFKIFKSYKDVRKVTIFGSARTPPHNPEYALARKFAEKIRQKGFMIITGAGPGIMQAGNQGAGPNKSFGVNIKLPFEQVPNKYIANESTYIDCRYFFTRKLVFVKEASGAAFFPGGFGTLDEAFELLTLLQTGKADPMPIVFLDVPGGRFWSKLVQFIKGQLLNEGKISNEDLSLYKIFHNPEEAAEEIVNFYSNYHSLRYVRDQLVIRMKKPTTPHKLALINRKFRDILTEGDFTLNDPLPEELNQPELSDLPRLIFKFNRINNGRLRQLIDFLNLE